MFRSSMTIIRELYLLLTKVIFMLKHSVKLRNSMYYVMRQHVVERHVCCVQCRVRLATCVLFAVQSETSHMCVVCSAA